MGGDGAVGVMSSRTNSQLSIGPMPLRGSEQRADAFRETARTEDRPIAAEQSFRESEQSDAALRESEQSAAALLDEAFERARLTNKEIAHICRVSVSLVEKWRSTEARGCPSFVQMLMLPPKFHIEMQRAMNRKYGFARAALGQALEALGALALAIEP